MPALLRRNAMLLDRAAAGLFPGYFAITMATGDILHRSPVIPPCPLVDTEA